MTTDFRQLKQLAHTLGLTYQQVLARYHTDQGKHAPRSGVIAWARREVERGEARRAAQAQHELRSSFTASQFCRWKPLTLRLDPGVLELLAMRADADRGTLARVSSSHYLDAALRTGPRRLGAQLACARHFLKSRSGPLPQGRPVTFLVGPDTHAVITTLRTALTTARSPRPETPAVISALAVHFLDHLPPPPPAR